MKDQETERISTIIKLLERAYPNAHIALTYRNPWELLVAVVLSAQCTDIMVNKVTPILFRHFPTVQAVANASQESIERDVRPTGFYRNKAKHIKEAAKKIIDSYGGNVPQSMEKLMTLPGVARKTANVVLANAFHISEGIAVDTHVMRLSQRLRFVNMNTIGGTQPKTFSRSGQTLIDYYKDGDPIKIERQLMDRFPQSRWMSITYQLIEHGRACCIAQTPHCTCCPLAPHCPTRRG